MNDILFGNNNNAIIRKLAKQSYKKNKIRNYIAVLAIILTTILICTIFLIGGSYISSWKLQQEQTRGTTGHATLNKPTQEQYGYLTSAKEIADVGIRADIIQPSFVNASFDTHNASLFYGMRFYNTSEWDHHRRPVLENITGHYPESADEIMVPSWVLKKWNITEPFLGMELPFTYQYGSLLKQQEKVFQLSGWFDEYDYVNDGNIAYLLVSEAFCNEVDFNLWDNGEVTADMRFAHRGSIAEAAVNMEDTLNLSVGQTLSVSPDLLDKNSSIEIIAVCLILGLGIVVCGYLLIYNVFYISVSNDVQFYGQLRTIGTIAKQIGRIIFMQTIRIAAWGIGIGLVISYALSNLLIPLVLGNLSEVSSGIVVEQQPLIYIGAALFSLITVILSVRRPIKIAKSVSPIAAMRYQDKVEGNSTLKSNCISTEADMGDQNKKAGPIRKHAAFSASGMAFKNIKRTRKKSILAILSIFLGITSCLTVSFLIQSMSTDNYISNTMKHDIELTNQTLALGYSGEQKQVFDDIFRSRLKEIEGTETVSMQKEQMIVPEYSENIFYPYISDKYESKGMEAPGPGYYEQYPSRFYTQLISIEAESLKDYLNEKGLDYEGFYNGSYGLLVSDRPELFPDAMSVSFQWGQLSRYEASAAGEMLELPIGGFLPGSYYGGVSSDAPYIFVSEAGMEKYAPNAYITSLGINVDADNLKQAAKEVQTLCNESGNISITSKAELIEGLHRAKTTLYTLGGGIAFVLAFIGIINFANIMFTNIESRKHELSVMESIGMTKKQCCRMLQMEGIWYAVISLVLCFTVGNLLVCSVYLIFKSAVEYAAFSYPFGIMIALSLLLLTSCWYIPQLFAKNMMKKSTIERLRQS